MPAEGFAAFFEVASETFGLTVACVCGFRYAVRCAKKASPLNISGLSAALLAAFFCLYGLTYWFNGINGYSCDALATVTGACLSVSNAITFVHLFVLSNDLHERNTRWETCRWIGLLATAFNWGTLVVAQLMVTTEEDEGGIDGIRCVLQVDVVAFRLKWAAQLLNELFQAVAFILPLRCHLAGAARVHFRSGKPATYRGTFRYQVWRSVTAVFVSLVMTVVVAALAFAKAGGRLGDMPMFAVETLDNGVNLVAIFFAVHTHVDDNPLPKQQHAHLAHLARIPQSLDPISTNKRHRSLSFIDTHGGCISPQNKHDGGGGAGGAVSIDDRGGGRSSSGRGAHSLEALRRIANVPVSSSRRQVGPIKRLPPVRDMSPEMPRRCASSPTVLSSASKPSEVTAGGASAGIGGKHGPAGGRHVGSVRSLFFSSQPARNKWTQPGPDPIIPGDLKMRDNRPILARTETDADRSTTSVDSINISALNRDLVALPPRGGVILSRSFGVRCGIGAGTCGGASTPAVRSPASYELEDHRAVTSAAASEAARVASIEANSSAVQASSTAGAWPVLLGSVSAGVSTSAARIPSAADDKSTPPLPVDGQEECKECTAAGAGMEQPGEDCGFTESESAGTEDEGHDRVESEEPGVLRSSVPPRNSTVFRERRAMRATPREVTVTLNGPPSSSTGFHSMQTMSAFSAASLFSSYDGESSWYGAPALTVRSPASYFDNKV